MSARIGVENRQVGAIRRDGNAGLRHQREQAERFQGDGLAAGVGSGDHELAMVAFELDGDGDDLRVLELQIALEERMSGAVEEQASFARLGRARAPVPTQALVRTRALVPTQAHRHAVVVFGEAGFGELEFEFGEDVGGGQNRIRVFADLARHFKQDAMDLALFFIQQAHQFVILLDGFERLDKHGLSAGTGAVHHALHAAFLLDFYRDDEALAADGDQFVLHRAAFGEFPQVAAQRFLDLALLLLDLAANAAQFGRRAIVERAVGQNLVAERAQEAGEVLDAGGKRGHGGPLGAHRGGRLAHDFAPLGSAVGDQHNVADLSGLKSGSADARLLDQLSDFGQAGEFETSADAAILADFGRELLLRLNPGAIERRQKFRDAALAQRRRGVAGEQVAQRLELKQARTGVGDWIGHEGHVYRRYVLMLQRRCGLPWGASSGVGVLRLRRTIRFANCPAPLSMTRVEDFNQQCRINFAGSTRREFRRTAP